MTLGDMLILEMLGEDCIDGEKFQMITEKQQLEKVRKDKIVYGHLWYITLDDSLVDKRPNGTIWVKGNSPVRKLPVQAMCWNDEYYIADVWYVKDGISEKPTNNSNDRMQEIGNWLENQGWELIPTEYYDREVEGT